MNSSFTPAELKEQLTQLYSELLHTRLNKNQPEEEKKQKLQSIENKISVLKKQAYHYVIDYSKDYYEGNVLKTEHTKDVFISFEDAEIDDNNWHKILPEHPQLMKDMQDFAVARSLKSVYSITKIKLQNNG